MNEFWEAKFTNERTSWGFEPSNSAIWANDFFLEHHAEDILIPGIGYGRSAGIFLENGMSVTGIEISKTAIDIARKELALTIQIFHGSVADMPFDNKQYDGIFCYALIQLLDSNERKKFIKDCYDQMKPGCHMMFTVPSKKSVLHGKGRLLSKNRYELRQGLNVYFYDSASILREFNNPSYFSVMLFLMPIIPTSMILNWLITSPYQLLLLSR